MLWVGSDGRLWHGTAAAWAQVALFSPSTSPACSDCSQGSDLGLGLKAAALGFCPTPVPTPGPGTLGTDTVRWGQVDRCPDPGLLAAGG